MKIVRNVFTIADLNNWLEEGTLIVSKDYQRAKGLWPLNARCYFIDSILNGFPFPKITLRQTINLLTKKSIREIVDGQQRMMTISDFVNNRLVLSASSEAFKGKTFSDLEDEIKQTFMSYEVSVDTAVGAMENEILEIFRRMNSYTLPLNEPEKRHATYQGEFKWFIKDMIQLYTPLFESCEVLTVREISRMQDADLVTELAQLILTGITGRNAKTLNKLYKDNDKAFREKNDVKYKLVETLDFIKTSLFPVCNQKTLRSYSFYSLFSALLYNRWGIKGILPENINGINPLGSYTRDLNRAVQNVLELYQALDLSEEHGMFGEFVIAHKSATNNKNTRQIRMKWLVAALQDRMDVLNT